MDVFADVCVDRTVDTSLGRTAARLHTRHFHRPGEKRKEQKFQNCFGVFVLSRIRRSDDLSTKDILDLRSTRHRANTRTHQGTLSSRGVPWLLTRSRVPWLLL